MDVVGIRLIGLTRIRESLAQFVLERVTSR
jgi:hypothetical protein